MKKQSTIDLTDVYNEIAKDGNIEQVAVALGLMFLSGLFEFKINPDAYHCTMETVDRMGGTAWLESKYPTTNSMVDDIKEITELLILKHMHLKNDEIGT